MKAGEILLLVACAVCLALLLLPFFWGNHQAHLDQVQNSLDSQTVSTIPAMASAPVIEEQPDTPDEEVDAILVKIDAFNDDEATREALNAMRGRHLARQMFKRIGLDNWFIRNVAVNTLSRLKEPAILPELMAAMNSRNAHERMGSLLVLAEMQKPEALEMLVELAKSSNSFISYEAITGLGSTKYAKAVPVLSEVLSDKRFDEGSRAAAARALSRIGGTQAVQALLKITDKDASFVRLYVAGELLHSRPAEGLALMKGAMQDCDPHLLMIAINYLGCSKRPEAFDLVLPLLENEDEDIVMDAASALAELGNPLAMGPIEKAANRVKKDYVRKTCERAASHLAYRVHDKVWPATQQLGP